MLNFNSLPMEQRVYNAKQMRLFDETSIKKYHTPSKFLMGNAGQAIALEVIEYLNNKRLIRKITASFKRKIEACPVILVCGKGNNGGDGAAAAIWLKSMGIDPILFLIAPSIENISPDSAVFFRSASSQKIKIVTSDNEETFFHELSKCVKSCFVAVDCLLGTGIKGNVKGLYKRVIDFLNMKKNEQDLFVIAADIPSGVSCDSGFANTAVKASVTLAFGAIKPGHLIWPGLDFTGKVRVIPICLAPQAAPKPYIFRPSIEAAADVFRFRKKSDHKGKCGKASIIGGSSDYSGALRLACFSALCGGPGYVFAFATKEVRNGFSQILPEVICPDIDDFTTPEFYDLLDRSHAIALGPGMGMNNELSDLPFVLMEKFSDTKLIMDADALNIISLNKKRFQKINLNDGESSILFTPHPAEFSRLTGHSIDKILANPLEICIEYASANRVNILLKGVIDILVSPQGNCALIDEGHQCVTRAGTGDVLTGLITAFAARGMTLFDSAWLGSWFLRRSAKKASTKGAGEALRIGDLPNYYESVFHELFLQSNIEK